MAKPKGKDSEVELGRSIRALVLRYSAIDSTYGLYAYARYAAGKRTIEEMCYELSRKIANPEAPPDDDAEDAEEAIEAMTVHEQIFLSKLLHAIGEKVDVVRQLKIKPKKIGHNPSQQALAAEALREFEQRVNIEKQPEKTARMEVADIIGKKPKAADKMLERAKAQRVAKKKAPRPRQ